MIEVAFIESISDDFALEAHCFHYLECFFIHMHCGLVLSNRAIVGIRKLRLVTACFVEQIIDIHLVQVIVNVVIGRVRVKSRLANCVHVSSV